MLNGIIIGITLFWTIVFVCIGYLAALILFACFRKGIIRGLGILPVYIGLCSIPVLMPFSLSTGVGILFGAVPGMVSGLILIFVLLNHWDKRNV